MTDERGVSRRSVLGAGGAAAGIGLTGDTSNHQNQLAPTAWQQQPGQSGVTLRWLGNNAWEISFGTTRILVDPWVTRFVTGTYTSTGTRPDTKLVTDPAIVDRYVTRADQILICHGHFDHMADVSYIADKTKATVFGTESHLNMLRAMLPTVDSQLATVRGGENMQFTGYTVEVFRSLHSMAGGARHQVPFPGTRPGHPPHPPVTVADLVEGETLAYQITVDNGPRVFILSTANFVEHELLGLRPDVAILAVPGNENIHDYTGRLLRVLGRPRWILPTHWDDFDLPLDQPARDWGGLTRFRTAVAAASPHSHFTVLDHLQTFEP